jgi:ABC-type molybdate transport system substrate-binding protein
MVTYLNHFLLIVHEYTQQFRRLRPVMLQLNRIVIIAGLLLHLTTHGVYAAEPKEIESITVLADNRLAVPLAQLSSMFAHSSMISVANTFGSNAAEQKKKIEDGEPADVFITADAQLVQQLKVKGMVDVYSIGEIAKQEAVHYTAVVVAGENMTPARNFLEYLKSADAREIFTKNGLSVP